MAQRETVEDFYNEYPDNVEEDPWYDGYPEEDWCPENEEDMYL